jgi:hypothetical protein
MNGFRRGLLRFVSLFELKLELTKRTGLLHPKRAIVEIVGSLGENEL